MTDPSSKLDSSPQEWLTGFVQRSGGVAGTIHVLAGEVLVLEAALNIPPKVQEVTRTIPRGKGMAGLAWERSRPVQTCNLKTDSTGDVRPGAKAVDAQAAIAIPVYGSGGELAAVVGVAFHDERELDEATVEALRRDAATLVSSG